MTFWKLSSKTSYQVSTDTLEEFKEYLSVAAYIPNTYTFFPVDICLCIATTTTTTKILPVQRRTKAEQVLHLSSVTNTHYHETTSG